MREKMPPFPKRERCMECRNSSYAQHCPKCSIRYERALREAWESRCRVAVEALRLYAFDGPYTYKTAHHALTAIGPLPK